MSKETITVGIRVRPLTQQQQSEQQCVTLEGNKLILKNNHKYKQFQYQYAFEKNVQQQQIFEYFALPLVQEMFKGYNACLIAYGQNKSGKTYTICGKDSEQTKGIIPRIVDHINCKLYADSNESTKYILRVSYIDIYKQEIIDLLTIRKGVNVDVVQKKRKILLKNLEMKTINKIQDIQSHFLLGNRKRELAYTKKYRNSEESTSVFTIYLESIQADGRVKSGKFDIVELQASDQVNRFSPVLTLATVKEHKYDISMNTFKNVINGLVYGKKQSHIPYNDSKITKILRDNIGGNSKTKIIFHIYPISKCYNASLSTLRTAQACSLIQNTASPNFDQSNSFLIKSVTEQLNQVGQQLSLANKLIQNYRNISEQQIRKQMHEAEEFDNQFLSQSVLIGKIRQKQQLKLEQSEAMKQSLNKKEKHLKSLFLVLQPLSSKQQLSFYQDNYSSAIEKLAKQPPFTFGISEYQSAQNWNNQQTSVKKAKQKERLFKQQVYDLQRQFQEERELMLSSLREIYQKYKFYERISQKALKKEEIDLLKMNSKYDEAKREYEIPLFAVRDKRISHGSRFLSPQQHHLVNSRTISERKFLMSQISSTDLKELQREKPNNSKAIQNKQTINNKQQEDHPYFNRVPKNIKAKIQKEQGYKMTEDDYQLVRSSAMSNRIKQKTKRNHQNNQRSPSSAKSIKMFKPLSSSRFKFK